LALLFAAGCTVLACEPVARAQGSAQDATRVSARQLGEEGTKLFEAGDYAGALDRFRRADALVPRQTLGLRIARCLDKLGRLTEAYERYVAVARMPVAAGLEPDIVVLQNEAKVKADAEGAALAARIPSLVIEVKGGGPDASVTVDGVVVPPALLGVKRAVDPGVHKIVATSAGRRASRDVNVKEGEALPVALTFDAAAPTQPGPVSPAATTPVAEVSPPPKSSAQRSAGIALLALGGAGIVAGAAVGGAAVAKKSSLVAACGANLQCRPSAWGDADAYNTLRVATTGGLVAGAVLAATGAVVFATVPKSAPPAALWIGPRGLGVRGSF
jgi:hypothetical protein